MDSNKTRMLFRTCMTLLCLAAMTGCQRSRDLDRAAPETAPVWTLTLATPIDHLEVVAREPMILEHPDGSLFVGGFGASRVRVNGTDELTVWKSRDGGTTWARVDVGPDAPRAQGAVGNSDMDLAAAPDGTIYFVTLFFDVEKYEGRQISVGVSKDVGATWTWTLLSKTRFDDRPWVKVAPDGTAHVIWNDGAGVCHAVSQDGGLTWTERQRIHPQGCSSHLAMGPNGEMAVRITPPSASGNRYDEGVDLIAVSTDRGMTWRKYAAPGVRKWAQTTGDKESIPRWVEPLAWDVRGSLYSLWTGPGGVWLARSADQGETWTKWRVADGPEPAFYPYLVARGPGELAATWFSARQEVLQAHAARIDAAEGGVPPRVVESQPFVPDCWQESRSPDGPSVRYAGGEYLAVSFLRKGGLAVVSPVQNWRDKRFGFSLWTFDERRGGSRPKTEETGSKIDYAKLYAFCLDADVRSALSLIRQYDSSSLSEKDCAFKSQFESRFGFESDKSSYMSERKSQLDDILGLYRDYWRLSLLSPDEDFSAVIKKNVSKFLSEKYGLAQTGGEYVDDEILYEYLKKHVQALGYKTTGFVKTGKLFDFLVWKNDEETVYNFSVGGDPISTKVTFLDAFLSLGWEEYATFGYYYPGGWISPDALFCVKKGYDLKSENFLISYLCHEGRHFSDYKKYPKLNSVDMEYRAKLTELAMLEKKLYERIESFMKNSNRESQSSHSVANYCVIRDLSKALFNSAFENDIDNWKKTSPKKIHDASTAILKENTQHLIEIGPNVEHYLIW
jgi:hypothetical protein